MKPANVPSSIRKAAVLVVSLRRETADALLARMLPQQAEQIRQAVATLGEINPAEQRAVIEEFHRIGPFKNQQTADIIQLDQRPTDGPPPLAFLQHHGAAEIAGRLVGEHPQIIAVVLAHLSPSQAASALAQFPSQLRNDVVARLAGSTAAAPDVVSELEAGLRMSLFDATNRPRLTSNGVDVVRSILEAADRPLVDEIIAGIAQGDRALADRLRDERTETPAAGEAYLRPVAFDDLVDLDDADLDTVLHALDADVLALALTGCERGLLERVLERLPRAERRHFAHALDHLGPTRLSDVEAARRNIAMLAQQLANQARITAPGARRLSVAA